MNKKIVIVAGTRPEAIKTAPVFLEFLRQKDFDTTLVSTGQHKTMLTQAFDVFGVTPSYELDVMRKDQTPAMVHSAVMSRFGEVLSDFRPDWVLVQGDTTSALSCALAAKYERCLIGHIEAGLRTGDWSNPFPEEVNRKLIDQVSDLLFAPTAWAMKNLVAEGIDNQHIIVTGNTIVDALAIMEKRTTIPAKRPGSKLILVTVHRRENHGKPLESILNALKILAERKDVEIVFPVHKNPNVQGPVTAALKDLANVTLLPPVDYTTFLSYMKVATLILTDSGGIQEEAPYFGTPVLVLRDKTERPEAIICGTSKLVGTSTKTIVQEVNKLLSDHESYNQMANVANPFGDGQASKRIVEAIRGYNERAA